MLHILYTFYIFLIFPMFSHTFLNLYLHVFACILNYFVYYCVCECFLCFSVFLYMFQCCSMSLYILKHFSIFLCLFVYFCIFYIVLDFFIFIFILFFFSLLILAAETSTALFWGPQAFLIILVYISCLETWN